MFFSPLRTFVEKVGSLELKEPWLVALEREDGSLGTPPHEERRSANENGRKAFLLMAIV